MKNLILLCDGMSDYPCAALGHKTPMQTANKPNMDKLAQTSELGLCKTVDDNLKPGSDVANLSVLGYDPTIYYSGRSPLEAASMGVEMSPADVSLRCNLVTLSKEPIFCDKTMLDYCADDISSAEADILIKFLDNKLGSPPFSFHSGVSYRHLLLWKNGSADLGALTAPHDIIGKKIAPYINKTPNNKVLYDFMEKSCALLSEHPVNTQRVREGKRPANAIWLWGEGQKRELPSFESKYGIKGAMISAVDLLKGIGKSIAMDVIEVKGATGYLDTNFDGKANAAVTALKNGMPFVYLHIEAPDECAHRGEAQNKVKSIELIDKLVLAPVLQAFEPNEIKILIMPDHATPLTVRTHTNDPVPYLLYDGSTQKKGAASFNEETAAQSGIYIESGHTLIEKFLKA